MTAHLNEQVCSAINWACLATVIGTLAGWLPPLAAALSAIWYGIQIYQSKFFQEKVLGRKTRD